MNDVVDNRRIKLHGPEDFAGMRAVGTLAAAALDMITAHVREGITTAKLDRLCQAFILDHCAIPASLGYRGYTHATCISLNHVVCHGFPGDRVLMGGTSSTSTSLSSSKAGMGIAAACTRSARSAPASPG